MENGWKRWQEENYRLTKEGCYRLLRALKEQQLDPIPTLLSSKDGASVTFAMLRAPMMCVLECSTSSIRQVY